jgi:hypothetical protein
MPCLPPDPDDGNGRPHPANSIGTLYEQLALATGPRPAPMMSRAEYRRLIARLAAHPDEARALDRVLELARGEGGA